MIRLYAIFSLFCSLVCLGIKRECDKSCFDVRIYHLIDNANWGETDGSALQGRFQCLQRSSPRGSCSLHSSDSKSDWLSTLQSKYTQTERSASQAPSSCCPITVSMYHIHTWGGMSKWPHGPNKTALPSDLTLVESEESHARFGRLFHAAFPLYDGNSTTHPRSTIQRSYFRGWNSTTLLPLRPFNELIKAGVFIASTCHRGSETKRLQLVRQLQSYIRIDSLGKCMTTRSNPDDIVLKKGATEQETLRYKQESISKYMFYLAFENSFEPGYVTEKVFDALIAGKINYITHFYYNNYPYNSSSLYVPRYRAYLPGLHYRLQEAHAPPPGSHLCIRLPRHTIPSQLYAELDAQRGHV